MYQIESSASVLKNKQRLLSSRLAWLSVGPMVVALGFTSFFTDISAEMVNATLPIYLSFVLRLAPFQLGIIDGVYQGATVLVRLVSGVWADRTRRHKEAAVMGYGLSAFSKLGLLLIGGSAGWAGIIGITIMDRIGKGIRTSPRDAMIAASVPDERLATAFGVHRTMDTAGAMLGPLLASAVLWLTGSAYDAVFVVSLCFAFIGLAVLGVFVHKPNAAPDVGTLAPKPVRVADGLKLLNEPRFRRVALIGVLLSLATVGDGLLHLNLQRKLDLMPGVFPLLYVFVAMVYMLFAIPLGRLADRFGRERMFLLGYVPLGLVYGLLWVNQGASGVLVLVVYVLLLGVYYAATEGILIAIASSLLPEAIRTSGLALFTSFTGMARLVASVLFGAAWSAFGSDQSLLIFLVGLAAAITASIAIMRSQLRLQ
jgi:MFS family permease